MREIESEGDVGFGDVYGKCRIPDLTARNQNLAKSHPMYILIWTVMIAIIMKNLFRSMFL